MTKKDYKAIAEIIKKEVAMGGHLIHYWNLAQSLCSYFKKDNPKFDADKFMSAIIDAPSK